MTLRSAVVALAALLIVPRIALAQQPKTQAKAAPTPAEAAAIAQEQRILQSLSRGDAAAMNDALGQPSLMVGSDGFSTWTTETTVSFLKACESRSVTGSDFRSIPAGKDVVVVAYAADGTRLCRGRSAHDVTNALSVWERKGGRWSQVAHTETDVPAAVDGIFEYLPPLKGMALAQGGHYSFVFGPADGSGPMTANTGTYRLVGDTVVNTILYSTDPANPAGSSFRWIWKALSADTLGFSVLDPSGRVTFSGRTVRVR